MADKGGLAEDPRGLIFEAYRIHGISLAECKTIFLDWALWLPHEADVQAFIQVLLGHYGPQYPDHPMTGILKEGTKPALARRRGRRV